MDSQRAVTLRQSREFVELDCSVSRLLVHCLLIAQEIMDGLPEDDASYSGNLFCIHFIQYNDESNKNIPLTSA